jgi:hypothetical protein
LNTRFSAELSFDYGAARRAITPEAQSSLNAAQVSFFATWTSFFKAWKSISPIRTFHVSDNSSFSPDSGAQLLSTGTLNIALLTVGKIIPYVAVGGGVLSNSEGNVNADLIGTYRTTGVTEILVNVDTVKLRSEVPRNIAVGVIGGGVRYSVTPRWGGDSTQGRTWGKAKTMYCWMCPGQTWYGVFSAWPALGRPPLLGAIPVFRSALHRVRWVSKASKAQSATSGR